MHFKHPFLLTAAALFMAASSFAQSIKITEGKLDVLGNEKEINVEYTYDNMGVGKFDKEQDYVSSKSAEMNKKEAGRGDTWAKAWADDRKNRYEPKFEEQFTLSSGKTLAASAKYTIIFHTTFTEPGFNVGVVKKNASINADVTIVETANRNNVVAKATIKNAPGRTFWGGDFDTGVRISEAYAMAGKSFGKKVK